MRLTARSLRYVILALFAVFFVVPMIWLFLAPTKSDGALVTSNPFAFGSFHHIAQAWDHIDAYSSHLYRRWISNSLLYAGSATAIVLATAVPAGYGLAFGTFRGRKLVLTVTLIVMIMPASALVLPIFLELNSLKLIGNVLSVILPFSFFPFGVYLAYIYYTTAVPPDLLDAARVDGCGEWQTFRRGTRHTCNRIGLLVCGSPLSALAVISEGELYGDDGELPSTETRREFLRGPTAREIITFMLSPAYEAASAT